MLRAAPDRAASHLVAFFFGLRLRLLLSRCLCLPLSLLSLFFPLFSSSFLSLSLYFCSPFNSILRIFCCCFPRLGQFEVLLHICDSLMHIPRMPRGVCVISSATSHQPNKFALPPPSLSLFSLCTHTCHTRKCQFYDKLQVSSPPAQAKVAFASAASSSASSSSSTKLKLLLSPQLLTLPPPLLSLSLSQLVATIKLVSVVLLFFCGVIS